MPARPPAVPDSLSRAEPVLEFYAEAIRLSSIPSYVVDTRRRMVAWNAAAEALLGYPVAAMVGHTCYRSPLDHQNQAGHRLCVGACPLVEAMAGHTAVQDRVSVRGRTGARRIITVAVVPLMDSGTGRVVGALEQFQLAPGWDGTGDREPSADEAAGPRSAPSKRPRASMDTPA